MSLTAELGYGELSASVHETVRGQTRQCLLLCGRSRELIAATQKRVAQSLDLVNRATQAVSAPAVNKSRPDQAPDIVSIDRLEKGVVVHFDDERCGIFSAADLHEFMREKGLDLNTDALEASFWPGVEPISTARLASVLPFRRATAESQQPSGA